MPTGATTNQPTTSDLSEEVMAAMSKTAAEVQVCNKLFLWLVAVLTKSVCGQSQPVLSAFFFTVGFLFRALTVTSSA